MINYCVANLSTGEIVTGADGADFTLSTATAYMHRATAEGWMDADTTFVAPSWVVDGMAYREETTMTEHNLYDGACCIDCALLIANGDTPEHMSETERAEWLAEWASRNADVHWFIADVYDDEYFSWTPCTTCGSTLGGNRLDIVGRAR